MLKIETLDFEAITKIFTFFDVLLQKNDLFQQLHIDDYYNHKTHF